MTPAVLQAETPAKKDSPVPKEVAGTAYDKNKITALPGSPGMSSNRGTTVAQVETYDQLLAAVRETRIASRGRVEKAVEQENVREAWEIGRLIDAHVLQHKERADYGKQVVLRLSKDLGMSDSELYRMLEFYRAYPILAHARKLSWSEQKSLLAVNDPKEREAVAEQAEKENWTRDRLREEVKTVTKKEKTSGVTPAPVEQISPVPHSGNPGTYKIILAKTGPYAGELAIDLGFSNYVRLASEVADTTPFREGEVVAFQEKEGEVREALGASPESQLYTYRAWVNRVLDGDTIEAVIDLGFGFTTTQTLRFRAIDAPELPTRDGVEAKEFVEKALQIPGNGERGTQAKAGTPVFIKTTHSDKYDRYLVDVFITDKNGEEQYLNNLLLEKGYAVKVQS